MRINFSTPEIHDMQGETIDVMSTSALTADASPIVLNQTDFLRFKFIPTLVQNEKEPQKSVSGKLLYEKKRKNEPKFPSDIDATDGKVSRGSVKVGDWMEFKLDTSETYELYMGLKQLYELYEHIGEIPYGSATYTRIDSSFKQFLSIIRDDPSAARMIGNEENYELVKILLRIITQADSRDSLRQSLSALQDDNLQHLASSLNVEKLQRVSTIMQSNLDNDDEEFWQTSVFKENQWVLAQLFSCPCTIFADKAYVGGKSLNNRGGNLCDFIYRNSLSKNVALIEIKTPCTDIFGGQYRGTFSFSYELSGAVNQVLNYKDNLTKEYYSLCQKDNTNFEVFSPKCVVVIGKISSMTSDQIAAFENFRNSLNNVTVITFDELHQRIMDLINILSANDIKSEDISENVLDLGIDDELPF